jgi:hypothetical protein
MPGEFSNSEYNPTELREMSREDFDAAAARGFKRPRPEAPFPVPAGADLTSATPTRITLGSAVPKSSPIANPNAWVEKKSRPRPFTCPSGQTCLLQSIAPEALLERGLLDQISRLEGLADELVQKAEGQPPTKPKMPSREDFKGLLEVLNAILPLAVVEPVIAEMPAEGESRNPELIYPDDVDLEDRMAILEESMKALRALDRFRNA